jgi:hypothetical protein
MPDGTGRGVERLSGLQILAQLRVSLSRDDIARDLADYKSVTGYDASLQRLRQSTEGRVDLRVEAHRLAIIDWLRSWRCPHLRRADTRTTSEALQEWFSAWGTRLVADHVTLLELSEPQLIQAGEAYDALRTAAAAHRSRGDGQVDVAFGGSAAAKAMFAVRPQAFLPWDTPIRAAFRWSGHGSAYLKLLRVSGETLEGLARRFAVPVGELPAFLGRPGSSPPKLIDEYLWIRVRKDRWAAGL